MGIEITIPNWIRVIEVTPRLTELNPAAAEALIETLRDALPEANDRVRLLFDVWEALTA